MTKRWHTVTGKVISIRLSDSQFQVISRRAADKGLSPGDYIKWTILRNRHKGKSEILIQD